MVTAPTHRGGDACISDRPKGSYKVLSVSEKEKVLSLIRKGKKILRRVAEICGKNKPAIREIVEKEKEIRASLLSHLRLRELRPRW